MPYADPTKRNMSAAQRRAAKAALAGAAPPDGWTPVKINTGPDGAVGLVQSVPAAAFDDRVDVIPAEHYVRKVSSYLNSQGAVTGQWVMTDTQKQTVDAARWAAIEELVKNGVVQQPRIVLPERQALDEDLCNLIVFGDPHVGMLAQARETGGQNWDLKIAKRVMSDALQLMLQRLPKAGRCILVNIGDYFHFQDNSKTTPTSKHQLDGDCRLAHMAELGCYLMAELTEQCLIEYGQVTEANVPGNHDPDAARWLNIFMRAYFRNVGGLEILDNAAEHLYTSFGQNLIGMHHGHSTPIAKLQHVLGEWREGVPWGAHKHRRWVTGHHHTYEAYSYPGVIAEKYPTLAPLDFYAAGAGYRSERSLNAVVLHREHGEIGRARVLAAEVE